MVWLCCIFATYIFNFNETLTISKNISLTGTLFGPLAIFAQTSWYGLMRTGVESSDGNSAVKDSELNWAIQGSTEDSERPTARCQFKYMISMQDAEQPGGHLAYVGGLSGGFRSNTVVLIWSASSNADGAITDNSYHYGDSQTSYQHGNAISNDLMALQFDAVYGEDGDEDDPHEDLGKVEFGLNFNLGDIGKVVVSSTDKNTPMFQISSPMKTLARGAKRQPQQKKFLWQI